MRSTLTQRIRSTFTFDFTTDLDLAFADLLNARTSRLLFGTHSR